MSSLQSGSRRHSARLQRKEDETTRTDGASSNGMTTSTITTTATKSKKRKQAFEEEDDGFVFTRAKNKKARSATTVRQNTPPNLATVPEVPQQPATSVKDARPKSKEAPAVLDQTEEAPKKRRKKRMSFSTPGKREEPPVRRSKRLSTEVQEHNTSPAAKPAQDLKPPKRRKEEVEKPKPPAESVPLPEEDTTDAGPPAEDRDDSHSATKIALPFADTPVISRNKAMREGKAGKSERRSSLGLRGRRASSLIDTGSSALPHAEVEVQDFYKHIGSDLVEPRRMRQLLTWCATRAMHPKPQGTSFEEASARSAARVIEEELLRDIANKSELSDWFSREEAPAPVVPLPERPHPKNVDNAARIANVEEQLKRLRSEKEALEALLRPPSMPESLKFERDADPDTDEDTLTTEEVSMLTSLRASSSLPSEISTRVSKVTSGLGPAIDTFADGVHKINQYRIGADQIASRLLSVCAEKLSEKEKAGKRKALGLEDDQSPGRELSSVLRGLSKADR